MGVSQTHAAADDVFSVSKEDVFYCTSCVLDTSDYFRSLGPESKRALRELLRAKSLPRRTTLYREADNSEYLYILQSGEVKLYQSLADGRQHIHKIANVPGDLIGCEDLFLARHNSTAESITDVRLCCLRQDELRKLAQTQREISETLMRTMSRHLNCYIRRIGSLGQKNGVERVASYLLFLHETHAGRSFDPAFLSQSLTRTELAEMLGITQRTLIRCLKKLEGDGLISLSRGGITVRDAAQLAQFETGCG